MNKHCIYSKRKRRNIISKNLPKEENLEEILKLDISKMKANNLFDRIMRNYNKTIIKEDLLYSCSNSNLNVCKETALLTGLDLIRSGVHQVNCLK